MYLEASKESKRLLQLIHKSSKATGNKNQYFSYISIMNLLRKKFDIVDRMRDS